MTLAVWAAAALVFGAGLAMVGLRKNLLAMLLGLELMISAVNVSLVHHAGLFQDPQGMAAALLVIAVAAAEAVVGLCLILRLCDLGRPPESTEMAELRG